ncbi:MAG TPA: MOSC N-terminal beta barrel domain-containing protein [Pirellulales bacterium]|jgi:hypothetical protein
MATQYTARLTRINIFPIKSLDGMGVDRATVLASGALAGDRRWALRDARGEWINAKRNQKIHLLRATFTANAEQVMLRSEIDGHHSTFTLGDASGDDAGRANDNAALETWLEDFFGERVLVVEDPRAGFPDDNESPGPTIVGNETLAEVVGWFDLPSFDDARRRFRANLEIETSAPFWEDRLVTTAGQVVRFSIGTVRFEGTNPCQRCPVPTRDPGAGEVIHGFARKFADQRQATLPEWAEASRFDHFYRLAVNTRPATVNGAGEICVGDELKIEA